MTLALHGKSRRRQASLAFAAILAVLAAFAAAMATGAITPASADEDAYTITNLSYQDFAQPEGIARPGELIRLDFSFELHEDPGTETFSIGGAVEGPMQIALFEEGGQALNMDCGHDTGLFSCSSNGSAAPGTYDFVLLVRSKDVCESGTVYFDVYIVHPSNNGPAPHYTTEPFQVDCSRDTLDGAEVSVDLAMWVGQPEPDTFKLVLERGGSTTETPVKIGQPVTLDVGAGESFLSVQDFGHPWQVRGISCQGLGDAINESGGIRFFMKQGYAMQCAIFMHYPVIELASCYEGTLGEPADAARWGFRAKNIPAGTVFNNHAIAPAVMDLPFSTTEFIELDDWTWRWSEPVEPWEQGLEYSVRYDDLALSYGAYIGVPGTNETIVTPENRCATEVNFSILVCGDFTDDTGLNQSAVFRYQVNGQLLPDGWDADGGTQPCQPAYVTLADITETITVRQITPASWANQPGFPQRRAVFYQDNPQLSAPGDSIEVGFYRADDRIGCYEAGILSVQPLARTDIEPFPGTGLACHVIFNNVRMYVEPEQPTETPTEAPTIPVEDPTAPVEETETPTPSPTNTATATATSTATPSPIVTEPPSPDDGEDGDTTPDPDPEGGEPNPQQPEPSDPGDETDGESDEPEDGEVAGERTAIANPTPVAPNSGNGAVPSEGTAARWAVAGCFLFAASMAFAALGLLAQRRDSTTESRSGASRS